MRFLRYAYVTIMLATLLVFTASQAHALELRSDGSAVLTAEEVATVEGQFTNLVITVQHYAAALEEAHAELRRIKAKTGCS